ncbi:MAG: FixH family protein [Proteobacteria bacterium]|nr:FixH family protein [Pseudomonadota bacterium]
MRSTPSKRAATPPALCALAVLIAGSASCNSGEPQGHQHGSHAHGMDAGSICEVPGDTYVVGLEKQGNQLTVALVDALPAPPARWKNAWTIEVRDAAGMPVERAAITSTPFMPFHGHGTNKEAVITEMGGGRYQLDPVWLFMPGVWEVTLQITPAGEPADSVKYAFCIGEV